MSKHHDHQCKQIARLRAATKDAATTDSLTKIGAAVLIILAILTMVTTVQDVTQLGAFHTAVHAILAALVLYALNRVMRLLRPIAEMLLYNHDHFDGLIDGVAATTTTTAVGVNGVLRVIEQAQSDDDDNGTGPQPISRIGRS